MKEWVTKFENGRKETICGSDKYQEIKYAINPEIDPENSAPYVRYRNQRLFLDNFMRGTLGEAEKAIGTKLHGAYCTSYFTAYLIHINDDGDMAKVYYSYCS